MDGTLRDRLRADHRSLDELFGHLLAAASAGHAVAAAQAAAAFDEAMRRHMAVEEEHLLPLPPSRTLAAAEDETPAERLHRELRLEHVQIRELSAMIRRLLEDGRDVTGALRLAGNLARRWDAHTGREEREILSAD